jgi:hypothetical protein
MSNIIFVIGESENISLEEDNGVMEAGVRKKNWL